MGDLAVLAMMFFAGAAWGVWIDHIRRERRTEKRIIIDAPFSPEQAHTIMAALEDLRDGVVASSAKN